MTAVDDGSLPIGGSTGCCHETSAAIEEAAAWLAATPPEQRERPVIVELRERFGLNAVDACAAISQANRIRQRKTPQPL